MKRRHFLTKSLSAGLLLTGLPIIDLFAANKIPLMSADQIDAGIQQNMLDLLKWMKENGWQDYLKKELGIHVELGSGTDFNGLANPLINIGAVTKEAGIEDFGGDKLIEPGSPALSLLYHVLASPRVKSKHIQAYPALEQLDAIEDYIYAFVELASYPFQETDRSNVFLAVLAYEYRPAFKAPPMDWGERDGNTYAKMVYARTGIARTGTHGQHYDKEKRCFTNLPMEAGAEKAVAVMPARYGLFLVELVEAGTEELQIMNEQNREKTNLGPRYFINPIQKIANTEEVEVEFAEHHINEKLQKITSYSYEGVSFKFDDGLDFNKPPFVRISSTNSKGEKLVRHATDEDMVKMTPAGSTVLVSSIPNDLIREAKQYRQTIGVRINGAWDKKGNRRYSALKMPNEDGSDVANFVIADIIGRKRRATTAFKEPKISPLFANIKFELDKNDEVIHIDGKSYEGRAFEDKINRGNYRAMLFEDSICDGCVAAKVTNKGKANNFLKLQVLPAFSLVTAPDFFPFADSNDIRAYYHSMPKVNTDQDFLEGGTMNLSGIRQRGNPNLMDPYTDQQAFAASWAEDKSFDTITAVIGSGTRVTEGNEEDYSFLFNFDRKYKATSFLPDTGTGVFFPGWDATYSGDEKNPFFATFGLGSPFPEDMKLCAAANGMWPVTSPDAGRTFQGSLEPLYLGRKPNTATPLMDREIGLNKQSPYVRDFGEAETYGWDGEQGPFLQLRNDVVMVNYTDINRADYLQNLRDPNIGFDMSQLRELDSTELIHRMDCQRSVIKEIEGKAVWKSKLWLVAAEAVSDWGKAQDFMCLPQAGVFEDIDISQRKSSALKGPGYLYVFVLAGKNKQEPLGELDELDKAQKRRRLRCDNIWICQVTRDAAAYLEIKKGKPQEWEEKVFKR